MDGFLWPDNMDLENDTAWFVSGYGNLLFQLNVHTGQCKYIAAVPNGGIGSYRKNAYCMKYENVIICIPQNDNSIYLYELDNSKFSQISLSDNDIVEICGYWKINRNYLYLLSYNFNQIFMVNLDTNTVDKVYSFPAEIKGKIERGVFIENSIYFVNSMDSTICRFYVDNGQFELYKIPQIHTGLNCICFDGRNFLLSGYRKEIYIWNAEYNTVEILDKFPKAFGIYKYMSLKDDILDCLSEQFSVSTFFDCVLVGNCVWFIPFQTNFIIYVNTDNYCVGHLMIEEEEENQFSLYYNRELNHEYLLEYVREERYIGIYSIKNKRIFEIDTQDLSVYNRKIDFVNECDVLKDLQDFNEYENSSLEEKNTLHRLFFEYTIKNKYKSNVERKGEHGERIYQSLKE